jgi:hypothetical protein
VAVTIVSPGEYPDGFFQKCRLKHDVLFCWFFYKLRDAGEGPDELRMGSRKVVITSEALASWERTRAAGR